MDKSVGKSDRLDTLLELVDRLCSNSQIQDILRKAKELNNAVRVSAQNRVGLLENLRDAANLKVVTHNDLYGEICEAEESGHQLIRLYKARSTDVRSKCNDWSAVARTLFGKDWQRTSGFPLSNKGLTAEAWADFRYVEVDEHRSDWTARLDAGVTRRRNPREKIVGKKVITEHDLIDAQETYLIKWHRNGILEIRTPIGDSEEQRDEACNRISAAMQRVFSLDDDFKSLDLRPVLVKIRKQIDSPEGSELFSWVNLEMKDPLEGTAFFKAVANDGDLLKGEKRKQLFDLYKFCNKAAITWNFDAINVLPGQKKSLLTLIGSFGMNTVHIRANSSAKAVSYVVDQLRRLA